MCGCAVTTGVMMMGAILAAWTDATFNLVGYTAVFVNNIFTALYLVLMKNIKGLKDTSTVGGHHFMKSHLPIRSLTVCHRAHLLQQRFVHSHVDLWVLCIGRGTTVA